jgi:probable F420-dependent oxidoreductase
MEGAMRFGVTTFPTARTLDPVALAREVEDTGFESLFVPEHTHIPLAATAHPGGGEVPAAYVDAFAPLITLTAAAVATTRLKLGTGVCLVAQRDPILLAKELATLDILSGGRFIWGIGAGWNEAEAANHGIEPRRRFGILDERVAAIRAMWRDEEPEFHGRHVDFDRIRLEPKPRRCPETLVAGNGEPSMRRAIRLGDGWLPRARRNLERFRADIERFRELAADAGRPGLGITVYEARAEHLDFYTEMGVDRCVFMLPDAPAEQVRAIVRGYAPVVREGTTQERVP